MRPTIRLPWLGYVLRRLRRSPVFSSVVVATLALSLGALATVYAVVQAVLFAALPFAEPTHLVRVENRPKRNPQVTYEVAYADYVVWQRELGATISLAGFTSTSEGLLVGDASSTLQRVPAGIVSWTLFPVLGTPPLLGRALQASDDRPGAPPVVVISERLWRRRYAADPAIIGRRLQVEGSPRAVVGVMPAAFEYPVGAELWAPVGAMLPPDLLDNPKIGFFNLIGRLAPGASAAEAEHALRALQDRTANLQRPNEDQQEVAIRPLADSLLADTRRPLLLLLGGALVLVLLTCANVANLQLVRAIDRREELAVRGALGAGAWKLIVHPLGESLALGVLAAAGAVGVAWVGIARLVPLQPSSFFRASSVHLGTPVIACVAVAALLSVALFALAPLAWILRQRGGNPRIGSRTYGGGRGTSRLLDTSAMAQVALTTMLLLGAGVLLRSFANLRAVDPGFATEHVLTFSVPLFGDRYSDVAAVDRLFEDVVAASEAVPGVGSAAGVLLRPLQGPDGYDARYTVDGKSPDEGPPLPLVQLESVTPHYFDVMGIRLLQGRLLGAADREDGAPVIVVARAVAERLWPGENALGKTIHWGASLADGKAVTVVGIVGDARYHSLGNASLNVYLPYRQHKWPMSYLVVRTSGEPTAVLPQLRAAMRGVDPTLQPVDVATTRELKDRALARPRFLALLLGVLAALATGVAALGLHGVLAYVVALRRREMGIRLALGGGRRHTVGMVFLRASRLAAWGVASGVVAGLVVAWSLRRLLATELHGVSWTDPLVFTAVPLLVAALALLAASAPAAGVGRLDASEVLRG